MVQGVIASSIVVDYGSRSGTAKSVLGFVL